MPVTEEEKDIAKALQSEREKTARTIINPEDVSSWEKAWSQKITPWDLGEEQTSLKEVIEESGIPFPTTRKALVPGCGTGYDVFYLARRGLKVSGVDVAETAVEVANAERQKRPQEVIDNSNFFAVDFFKYKVAPEDRCDLAVDHTHAWRNDWGSQMAALIKPGGYLITIVFPIRPEGAPQPPYHLRPEHYDGPLRENFTKFYYETWTNSSSSHKGTGEGSCLAEEVEDVMCS